MRLEKFNSYTMEKCYAVNATKYKGHKVFLVAAEKSGDCCVFDEQGNYMETVWKGPSGTMSIVPLPDLRGGFLASRDFYSPNDSEAARIVAALPGETGWTIHQIASLPFVHRFDVVQRNGFRYAVAATIKSQQDHKDDWSHPGKVYVAPFPTDTRAWIEAGGHLEFQAVADHLTHNHGYLRRSGTFVIGADEGIFEFVVPETPELPWNVQRLVSDSTSDMVFSDLDGDGEEEIVAISPFHGDQITIYKREDGRYKPVYRHPQPLEFAHAIWATRVGGRNVVLVGNRKGERAITAFAYENGAFTARTLATLLGSANFWSDGNVLVATNREIDEIGFYRLMD